MLRCIDFIGLLLIHYKCFQISNTGVVWGIIYEKTEVINIFRANQETGHHQQISTTEIEGGIYLILVLAEG